MNKTRFFVCPVCGSLHHPALHASPAYAGAREQLLAAAAAIVEADGKISAAESDLLKSFAVALNCPPPRI